MKRQGIWLVALLAALTACSDETRPATAQTAADRGRSLVAANGCIACHALDGTRGIGPSWAGIYGTTRMLKGGGTVVVDDVYLRRAMLEPAAEVVDGFDNVMVPAAVNEAQIADIIALIKELGSPAGP